MGALGEPSLLGFLLATVLWVLLGVLPGLLVVTWLVPGRSRLERLAVAPLVSIALGFAPAAWLSAVGVPQAWHAAWVAPLVVTVALLVVLGRRGALPALVERTSTVVSLLLPTLASAAVWLVALTASGTGWSSVVPAPDGGSHGIFVTRILLSGSVSPGDVAVFDLADPAAGSTFYPLGLHTLAAPVAALTSVASSLLVPFTVLGSAYLVWGAAALARRVAGARSVVPTAWAAAVLVPGFPFVLVWWGPVPLVVGVALLPALVLALWSATSRRGVLVAALAVGGMLALHTTEALLAVLMVGLAALVARDRRMALLRGGVVACVLGAAVVGPVVWGLVAGGASRLQEPGYAETVADSLLWSLVRPGAVIDQLPELDPVVAILLLLAGLAVLAVSVVGAGRIVRVPLGLAVVAAIVFCLLLATAGRSGHPLALSVPWYGDINRLAGQAAALSPLLLGAGWCALVPAAATRQRRVLALSVLAVLAVPLVAQSVVAAAYGFTRGSVVGADDRAAYAWLADHVGLGERVLNQHRDGSVWAYDATRGRVLPVFGPKPSGGYEAEPMFAGPLRLRDGVGQLATDPSLRAEAEALHVRYVLVGSGTYSDAPALLDLAAMRASSAFREVFRSGDAHVLEIVPAQG